MYLSDGGIVVVVSDCGVIFLGGLGQLHRFGKRTQLMHAPGVSSVISLLTVSHEGVAHSSHYHENTSLHSET